MHPLDGARAKIERALKHIDQFDRDVRRFERDAYTVRTEPDTNGRVLNLFTRDMGLGNPPVPLLLLVGEFAYQLRSALDHVVYILANETRERDRQFPIFMELEKYEARAPSMIKGVSPKARAIIKNAQPFQSNPPNSHALWMLHELNNTDKHRVIPACLVYTSYMTINFGGGPVYNIDFGFANAVLKDGALLGSVPLPEGYTSEMNMDSETFSTVAFSEIADTPLKPVIPLLYRILTSVSGLVDQFAGEF